MGKAGCGRIELICGCMFSGKTERLVERLADADAKGIPVAAFKHATDTRYASRELATHNGLRHQAIPVTSSDHILELSADARLIAIDEGQFFGPDLLDVCRRLADQGKSVVVAALDRDSWGEPFGSIPQLREIADEVVYRRAVCSCGAEAEFTQRLAPVSDQPLIGGAEAYTARCARCFQAPPAELRR